MPVSRTLVYMESNPILTLTRLMEPSELKRLQSRPKATQRLIVYRCLEPLGSMHKLEDLADECQRRNYKSTYKKPVTDPRKFLLYSILYHLRIMESAGLVRDVI